MKVVINTDWGGFMLSRKAQDLIISRKNITPGVWDRSGHYSQWSPYDLPREDPDLVYAVETLGEQSWGSCAKLKVVEVPDEVKWYIDDYDGIETVRECHRSWS